MITIVIIPFKSFKERIRIMKKISAEAKIEVFKNYLYIEYKGEIECMQ